MQEVIERKGDPATAEQSYSRPVLKLYKVEQYRRKCRTPILIGGKLVTEYDAYRVAEYVDIYSGEIFSAADAYRSKLAVEPYNFGELALQRATVLNTLRLEVGEFADFVLLFRNSVMGLSPNVKTVLKWYSVLNGTRASNERRKIPRLEQAGILAGEIVLSPFQIFDRKVDRRQAVQDAARAEAKFSMMRLMTEFKGLRSIERESGTTKLSKLLTLFKTMPVG